MEIAFQSFSEFIVMGKHGLYVWLCFGLSFLLILFNVFAYQIKRKTIIKNIQLEHIRKQKQKENLFS
jgi:heme exporter protein D